MDKSTEKSMKVSERDFSSVGSAMHIRFYPLVAEEGKGNYIIDVDGNKYLDFESGAAVANTGHCHPKVVDSVKKQSEKLLHNCFTLVSNELAVEVAEKLIQLTPGDFPKKVNFGLSGADANECMVKLLPYHTKKNHFISYVGSYHGQTIGASSISGHPSQSQFPSYIPVTKVPYPYCYRCPFGLDYPKCNLHCAEYVDYAIQNISYPENTCALLVEPIQSDSGNIVPPDGYLSEIKKICEKHNVLFAVDEVKTGFGRTGKFFGIEHSGVVPDIVNVGKPIASGLPLSACITRSDILDSATASYLFTTGGNPVSCAAALSTFDVIKNEKLVENAATLESHLRSKLEGLQNELNVIGDVRGKGLLFGVEIVKDKDTKEPGSVETAKICYRAWQKGLVIIVYGLHDNVIEIAPPLTISEKELDQGIEILYESIKDVEKGKVSDEEIAQYGGW